MGVSFLLSLEGIRAIFVANAGFFSSSRSVVRCGMASRDSEIHLQYVLLLKSPAIGPLVVSVVPLLFESVMSPPH